MQGFPEHSRARLQALLKAGAITVDGRVPKATERLSAGQRVVLIEPDAVGTEMVPEDIPLEVLYEDEDVIVLIKPAGMVVHPGAGCHSGTLVHALLGRELRLGDRPPARQRDERRDGGGAQRHRPPAPREAV